MLIIASQGGQRDCKREQLDLQGLALVKLSRYSAMWLIAASKMAMVPMD